MPQRSFAGTALCAAALMAAVLTAGCDRRTDETAPATEIQAETPVVELNRPVTITGCVRAGESADTFVLTASRAEEEGRTVTYALRHPEATLEDLREHIGQQVVVTGVVRAMQDMTGVTAPAPAAGEPVGTAGEPKVRTTTTLEVQELEVATLRPLDEPCEIR